MDVLRWVVLESGLALLVLGGLISFALLVHWRRGGRARPLLIALGTTAALLVVEQSVVTPREHAASMLAAIEQDVQVSRSDSLSRLLSTDFRSGTMDRQAFLEFVDRQLRRTRCFWVRRTELRIEAVEPTRFQALAAYLADVARDEDRGTVSSLWRVDFVREPAGWRIGGILPVRIAGLSEAQLQRLGLWEP